MQNHHCYMDVVEGKIKCKGPLTWDPLKGMDPKILNQTMYKESISNLTPSVKRFDGRNLKKNDLPQHCVGEHNYHNTVL